MAAALARIVNTHCHSDHMGGNAASTRAYGCSIAVPEGEAPLVACWDTTHCCSTMADQSADRFDVDRDAARGRCVRLGRSRMAALAAPGHDMRALMFYNPEHRFLISGDALWENGYGFVMPEEIDPAALPATRATLEMLATLDVRIVDSRPRRTVHRIRTSSRAGAQADGGVRS